MLLLIILIFHLFVNLLSKLNVATFFKAIVKPYGLIFQFFCRILYRCICMGSETRQHRCTWSKRDLSSTWLRNFDNETTVAKYCWTWAFAEFSVSTLSSTHTLIYVQNRADYQLLLILKYVRKFTNSFKA